MKKYFKELFFFILIALMLLITALCLLLLSPFKNLWLKVYLYLSSVIIWIEKAEPTEKSSAQVKEYFAEQKRQKGREVMLEVLQTMHKGLMKLHAEGKRVI